MGIKKTRYTKNRKMKFSLALNLALVKAARVRRSNQGEKALGDVEKRYSQLVDMMEHYNSDFDERKYWAYGCNCLILGDRPMSDPGHGPPVDALDTICKAYKDCIKCAKMTHGNECIGEFVEYDFNLAGGEATCNDSAGSCERSLCECDAMFAKKHVEATDVYTDDYHIFYSTWDPETQCSRNGGSGDPQCCGGENDAFVLYNANNKQCCPDGSVINNGELC